MSVKLDFTNFDLFNGCSTSLLFIIVITIIERVIRLSPFGSALFGDFFYSFSSISCFHLSVFLTSWNEIQRCYIGEGISAAVVQQRTLLLVCPFLFFFFFPFDIWFRSDAE